LNIRKFLFQKFHTEIFSAILYQCIFIKNFKIVKDREEIKTIK